MPEEERWGDVFRSSEALLVRSTVNLRFGNRDFDGWVLTNLKPKAGEHILDVGCGIGKFSIPCAKAVSDKGGITAVDISEEMLIKLKAQAEEQNLNINTVCARMEEIACYMPTNYFDAALCSYALYYSNHPEETIRDICQCLQHGARLLVVGPDRGNNQELIRFLEQLGDAPQNDLYVQNFTYEIVIPTCEELFAELVLDHFENYIRFPDADAFLRYWQSGGYYHASVEKRVQKAIALYFSEHSEFLLTKRVVSLLALGLKPYERQAIHIPGGK